jgi:carbamate kinase
MIGYLLEQALQNRLHDRDVVTVETQVLVAADDPAFTAPSKPIGPVYDEPTARRLASERGWTVAPDGKYYRRVVPSPQPLGIVELTAIELLIAHGSVVICAGGGGVPVVRTPEGLRGVEAVIDKDLASSLLARELDADLLVIATDIDGVYADWGSPQQRRLDEVTPEELEGLDLPAGSMGPKVRAACDFVRATGRPAVIGSLAEIADLVAGTAGTRVRSAEVGVPA